eukprot:gnl/MRDRNA2_/MRDRNA2_155166_c0_seq1.p1 gnl/MRDRNA2_/MRDRNA2_155166_c0~~gnl/MRDRNA2_/MRDRNA2_155166_c0_seq1.p1  ORF type:complete len:497 (+),score=111.48 gnl/MRDRNA2_/MRDRNA2_155166_c0_seq1:85-1491(+)
MLEAAKGGNSSWAGWIAAMPWETTRNLPLQWAISDVAMLKGTELDSMPQDHNRKLQAHEWRSVIKPLIDRVVTNHPTAFFDVRRLREENYYEALALVRTRGVQTLTDVKIMVPLLDLFNHKSVKTDRKGATECNRHRAKQRTKEPKRFKESAEKKEDQHDKNHYSNTQGHTKEVQPQQKSPEGIVDLNEELFQMMFGGQCKEWEKRELWEECEATGEQDDESQQEDANKIEGMSLSEQHYQQASTAVLGQVLVSLLPSGKRRTRAAHATCKDIAVVDIGDAFLILAARPLANGAEVFHTYGQLAGSSLLYEFGFVAENNCFDFVKIYTEDVEKACKAVIGDRDVRNNLRAHRSSGGVMPDCAKLGPCERGLSKNIQKILHALCGEGGRNSQELTSRERLVLASVLEARDAKYGREGGATADRQRAVDAEAAGRPQAALALRLAAAERSILAQWITMLRRGHKRRHAKQ